MQSGKFTVTTNSTIMSRERTKTGHMQHVGHRQIGKWKCGPGGINCPCCVKVHPTKLKTLFARYMRRKAKLELSVQE